MINATYRVQFHAGFRFADAQALVPHLHRLGISHLYASPITRARQGSTHGYDVTDPTTLNPELGTPAEFDALTDVLREHGMGLVVDIVPNHMAVSPQNPWWVDVLENGIASVYAGFFSVEWTFRRSLSEEKLLLPVLGAPFGTVLEAGQLRITLEPCGLSLRYYEAVRPIDPSTYAMALSPATADERAALAPLLELLERLPPRTVLDEEALDTRRRLTTEVKQTLGDLGTREGSRAVLERCLERLNGQPGNPSSFDNLEELLRAQAYRIAYWRAAQESINYRRFFDVSELVGVQVEDEAVFTASHRLILQLVREGKVHGLRIDHIDGLFDPRCYLERLQRYLREAASLEADAPPFPVLVEKITLGDETLPDNWQTDGTTGYDFMAMVNGLQVNADGVEAIGSFYHRFTDVEANFTDATYENKMRVMRTLFRGELQALGLQLTLLAESDRQGRDLSPRDLGRALREVIACLPVYRTYTESFTIDPTDAARIEQAVAEARTRNTEVEPASYDFVRRVLLLDCPPRLSSEERNLWLRFVMRWQQMTGPIMAKGVEDTTFYLYNRLVSLNEVGGDLETYSVARFHELMAERQRRFPRTMNASSTHDTKRSEDVRARLHALSEIPDEWARCVARWHRWNREERTLTGGRPVPERNEEYMLYQILLGGWPLDHADEAGFLQRVKEYLMKASREGKTHSSWLHPNEEYERAFHAFVDAIFRPERKSPFRDDFLALQRRLSFLGAMNSLAATLLKITCPGFPDFYRGTLTWELSLVDPDNRRPLPPVQHLDALDTGEPVTPEWTRSLAESWTDGRVKALLARRALCFRNSHAGLFAEGEYLPLPAPDALAENLIAFARRRGKDMVVVAVPRLLTTLQARPHVPLGAATWGDATLALPTGAPRRWRNVVTGETVETGESGLPLCAAFANFPVAMLATE